MAASDTSTDEKVGALTKIVSELEESSKMLVRRDLDLRAAYNELKALDQQKSEFVSIAAHQLRTPLTSVNFALQVLRDATDNILNENQKHILMLAESSTKRMFRLIEELLMVDALEYGKLTLHQESLNISNLLREVVDSYQVQAEAKKITVAFSFEPNVVIVGDRQRLLDVFLNLIDNAVKYTPERGSITVDGSGTPSGVRVTITDTGIGIPPEAVNKMFRKFSRAENAQLVDPDGSGLGLYVCQKIAEQHGGTITFTTQIPQGTCFVVELPYNLSN